MKKWFLGLFLCSSVLWSQNNQDTNAIEVSLFRGNVLPHTTDLYHLQGHPDGMMGNFLEQTHGKEAWHSVYNFPDYGVYFQYQNYNNEFLGKVCALGALYNFYFLKRHLELKVSQGIGYATNPYDKVTNSKNKAFGSTLMANTNIGLYYKKENIIGKFGIQTGLLFTHFSNGRTKTPNSGINTLLFNIGLNYNFSKDTRRSIDSSEVKKHYEESIKYNFVFRSGISESPVIGSGQYPFYHIGFYADKRFNRKSVLQFGTELFLTNCLRDYIKYLSVAFPEKNVSANTDYKRIGLFTGYELLVNRISLEGQIGYYVYQPFKNTISIYDRIGFKYHLSKHWFAGFSVKTHMFEAEALEFGIGVRL